MYDYGINSRPIYQMLFREFIHNVIWNGAIKIRTYVVTFLWVPFKKVEDADIWRPNPNI